MNFIIILIAFLFLLLCVGYFLRKRNKNFNSYFLADRGVGTSFIFFTVTASYIGASTTIATIEKAVYTGFNAVWMLGIPTFLTVFVFILLNRRIRALNFVSLPAFLKAHYGKTFSLFAAGLVFFYMIVLAASQFVAWGKFVSGFTGTGYTTTILIGAGVVLLYSVFGGYLSVIFTDALQFILIVCAILFLLFYSNETSEFIKTEDFDMFSNFGFNILMVISFALAWIISPIVWQRIASAKSDRASRNGLLLSMLIFVFVYLALIFAAISLRQFGLGDDLGKIIKISLPNVGQGIVFLGIISAILSTADSAINIGSLTLTKDIFGRETGAASLRYAKIFSLVGGLCAIIIASGFSSIIKTLGLASEIMAEGFFIPGMAALLFGVRKPMAGLLSLLMGGGFSVLVFFNEYIGISLLPEWPYSLPVGLSLSAIGFFIGYKIETKKISH